MSILRKVFVLITIFLITLFLTIGCSSSNDKLVIKCDVIDQKFLSSDYQKNGVVINRSCLTNEQSRVDDLEVRVNYIKLNNTTSKSKIVSITAITKAGEYRRRFELDSMGKINIKAEEGLTGNPFNRFDINIFNKG